MVYLLAAPVPQCLALIAPLWLTCGSVGSVAGEIAPEEEDTLAQRRML
jgi:hypothetical protein